MPAVRRDCASWWILGGLPVVGAELEPAAVGGLALGGGSGVLRHREVGADAVDRFEHGAWASRTPVETAFTIMTSAMASAMPIAMIAVCLRRRRARAGGR